MGSPSSTMGMETKLLLGLAFLGLVLASPLPQPQPQPVVDPFGLIGRIFGLQGSGTLNSFKPEKPKPFKPEECICERTFHKKPDKKKKKKKPQEPCDCYGAPESGYGVPSKPVSVIYTYEPLTQEPTTYSVPASPTPEPVYLEHMPLDSYGIPEAKPVASYQPEAPVYEPSAPAYETKAPLFQPLTSYTSPCNPYQHVGRRRRSAKPNHTKSFDFFGDGGIFSPELAADFHTLRKKKREKKNPCF